MHYHKVNFSVLFFLLSVLPCSLALAADEAATQPGITGSLGLQYDNGLKKMLMTDIHIPVAESLGVTPYAKIWNQAGAWSEVGIGLQYSMSNTFMTKLSVGALNGFFFHFPTKGILSSFNRNWLNGLSVSLNFTGLMDVLEYDAYVAFYLRVDDQASGSIDKELIHYNVAVGLKPVSFISFGAYHEHFLSIATGGNSAFIWLGPYLNFIVSKNFKFQIAGGIDLSTDKKFGDDFYKITARFNF